MVGNGTHERGLSCGPCGVKRFSPGVMEGARRRGRWRGALMLQSTLFYVLAIGGFANSRCRTTGTVHTWAEFDYNGGAYGESGFYGKNMTDEFDCRVIGSESEVLRTLYNAINDGHPVVLYVTTGSGSQHWVTVIGYEGVDNPDNLSTDNFIILDPDRTSGLEPESLSSRGLTLRYGDWMGNVRISLCVGRRRRRACSLRAFQRLLLRRLVRRLGRRRLRLRPRLHHRLCGHDPVRACERLAALRGGNHSLARGGQAPGRF